MASIELKRSTPGLQPKRPRPHSLTAESDKLSTYHTLYRLNRAFELVGINLGRLEELGLFRREFLMHFQHRAQELRAEINCELIETLSQREQRDWARHGRHTLQWEKHRRDPNDVLLEAERIRARQRQKQKPTTHRKQMRA